MAKGRAHIVLAILSLWLSSALAHAETPARVSVFAAASLTDVLGDLADTLRRSANLDLRVTSAATSTLARQIEAGAKADVFFSADETWTDHLDQRNLIVPGTRRAVLGNLLVLVVPADRQIMLDLTSRDWLAKLPAGRIATGDPAHVPVGRYAQETLRAMQLWDAVAPRLVRADNVRSALVLVERGEAVAGIVYATDARGAAKVALAGTFPPVSPRPITYDAAVLRDGDVALGRRLLAALATDDAKAVFRARGFQVR